MKLKDLISELSQETGLPAGQVRKVTKALTTKLQAMIEQQEGFRSGDLVFRPVTRPAKPGSHDQPAKPERKMARVVVRPRKPKGGSSPEAPEDAPQT